MIRRRSRYIDAKPIHDWTFKSEFDTLFKKELENQRKEDEELAQVPLHLQEKALLLEEETRARLRAMRAEDQRRKAAASRKQSVQGIIKYHEEVLQTKAPQRYYDELKKLEAEDGTEADSQHS